MADINFTTKWLSTPVSAISDPTGLAAANVYAAVTALNGAVYYKVTAFNGGETTGSAPLYHTAIGSGVSVSFDAVSGATDYRLYRYGLGTTNFILVAQSSGSPIVDMAEISGDYLPTVNTTDYKSRGLGTTASAYYTVPNNLKSLVKEVLVVNRWTEDVNYSIYFVPTGESASLSNSYVYNDTIHPSETKFWALNTVLDAGESIYAVASELGELAGYAGAALKISGIEIG